MKEHEPWYSLEERKIFLKERYSSGSHHYFFEVKEAKNGSKYIVIAQRKKVGDEFIGIKFRLFEDEMLEFERILHKLIDFSLESKNSEKSSIKETHHNELKTLNSDLVPAFFHKLPVTNNWKEFERNTYYLLKLLGIPLTYNFLDERQAGKADGFFKIGNLAVIYDCTLHNGNMEDNKSEQINNYCNCLKQGRIEISQTTTEEFYDHHKQVWIITQNKTRQIKVINSIEIKEIAIQDIMNLYQERLMTSLTDQSLEMKLRNL
ncbi:MAG: hypothetical protein AB4062_17300 [Crocosphaera sp.]